MENFSRRSFMKLTGAGVAVAAIFPVSSVKAAVSGVDSPDLLSQLGLASYTTRKLTLDETIKCAKKLGLTHISLKDFHLPLTANAQQFAEVKSNTKIAFWICTSKMLHRAGKRVPPLKWGVEKLISQDY